MNPMYPVCQLENPVHTWSNVKVTIARTAQESRIALKITRERCETFKQAQELEFATG